MNTQISSKLAAFAVALVLNTLIIVGVAHVFTAESQMRTTVMSQGGAAALSTRVAA